MHRYLYRLSFAGVLLLLAGAPQGAGKAGGWRLAGMSSPYLQMHAGNPVNWYPWDEEALATARRENKPLFISIGYYTCHWCHVMARESFSDPAIAGLLNRNFIAIKIDREQRPDLDDAYMEYLQLTRGMGGWPMSVWATPDGMPFFAGTYFPPHDEAGQTGFSTLLTRVAALWKKDEPGIRKTAKLAVDRLRELQQDVVPVPQLDPQPVIAARHAYAAGFDELQGGFGEAPKFPEPARLLFLLGDSDPHSVAMATTTLDHMLAGGIHDQPGGGFHRYSTDFDWRVPHFEKMLYDQALMARVCLAAWQQGRQASYAQCVRDTLDFTLSALRDARGGFHAALSADSPAQTGGEMQEGAGYTWTVAQLKQAIPETALRAMTQARYGIRDNGNAISDPSGEMQGRNVLWLALDEQSLSARFGLPLPVVRERNRQADDRLRAARAARPPVPADDKVVTEWNGYLITTLARAGKAMEQSRYLAAAQQAASFILENLYDKDSGVLYRDWRQGVRGVPGFAGDYAALAEAMLALHAATGARRWLVVAQRLTDYLIGQFYNAQQGGFYNTTKDTSLWRRERTVSDDATLSANGMMLHVLPELAQLTGTDSYREIAVQTARWAAALEAAAPYAMPYSLQAWPRLLALDVQQSGAESH
jgi:uncharacterized protein